MFKMIWRNREGKLRLTWKLVLLLLLFFVLTFTVTAAITLVHFFAEGFDPGIVDGTEAFALSYSLPDWLERALIWVQEVVMLAVLALFIFVFDKMKLRDLGLAGYRGALSGIGFGMALGLLATAAIFFLFLGTGWAEVLGFTWSEIGAAALVKELLAGVLLFTLVAFSEELLFRGYFFNNHTGGKVHALVVSGLFFAAMHLLNPNMSWLGFLNIVLAGVLFAYMYMWSGSLYMPVGFHFAWNYALGHIFTFPVSGTDAVGLLRLAVTGPELLTGGAFGPEGGLTATVILIISLAVTRRYLRTRGYSCALAGPVERGTRIARA